tara:strand:+ start:388 stop:987 length:600 start_codon:yes stop_codon:yes gene_type:complete
MLKCVANDTTATLGKVGTDKNKILKNSIQVMDTSDDMNGSNTSFLSDSQSDQDDSGDENTKNNYDVSMTFLEGQRVKVEMKKQASDGEEDGEQILKEILKPKISESYQDEIDKLSGLINMVTEFVIPSTEPDKDKMIDQLKNTMMVMMIQARNLIKEMKKMTYRNNYLKNNVMLAAFVLDRCRKDVPETEEEFEELFTS